VCRQILSKDNLPAVVLALLLAVLVACEFDIGTEATSVSSFSTSRVRQLYVQWHAQDVLLEMSSDVGNSLCELAGLLRVFWGLPGPYVQTVAETVMSQQERRFRKRK
jgi:hypothetical protein